MQVPGGQANGSRARLGCARAAVVVAALGIALGVGKSSADAHAPGFVLRGWGTATVDGGFGATEWSPAPPAPPRPSYGVVEEASMNVAADLLIATFVFRSLPSKGAAVRTVWYYARRHVDTVPKPRRRIVTAVLPGAGNLPDGVWQCRLQVKPPGRPWKTLRAVRIRLR